jgi:hypothetical protein
MAVLAIDLDQTLLYSVRSAGPLDGVPTTWVEDYQGEPLSLMTSRAHDLLADLQRRHSVVPVTTRTPEQYSRVRFPLVPQLSITCNGGVLLRDGARDAAWDAHVRDRLTGAAPATEAAALFAAVQDEAWVRSWRQVEDLFVYLVAHRRDDIPAEWVAAVSAWGADRGWTISVQGRKAYAVPLQLSKGDAARRVCDELGGPLLAAGDSVLDRDLLEAADAAVRPPHGELHLLGWEGAAVVERSGALGGEDVLLWLRRQADA